MTSTELSVDGLAALRMLEDGHRLNCVSRVGRELMELGLAMPGWADDLVISEAGRRIARRVVSGGPPVIRVSSEFIADLSDFIAANPSIDPMAAPHHVEVFEIAPEPPSDFQESVIVDEIQPENVIVDERQRALRAAGVASGVTGVWVDEKWVHAFVDAWMQEH